MYTHFSLLPSFFTSMFKFSSDLYLYFFSRLGWIIFFCEFLFPYGIMWSGFFRKCSMLAFGDVVQTRQIGHLYQRYLCITNMWFRNILKSVVGNEQSVQVNFLLLLKENIISYDELFSFLLKSHERPVVQLMFQKTVHSEKHLGELTSLRNHGEMVVNPCFLSCQ